MTDQARWLGWLRENPGVDEVQALGAMIAQGLSEGLARSLYRARNGSGAADSPQPATSAETLLAIRHQVRLADPSYRTVARLSRPSRQTFRERAYSANEPLVLTDVAERWPAVRLWTGEYLREALGDTEVESMMGREADPDYEANCYALRTRLPFSELAELVESGRGGNDVYMTANNHFLERPEATPLLKDFEMPSEYLDPATWHGRAFLWYGSEGTVTRCHYDTMNVLFAQVRGTKRFWLVPPELTPRMRNARSVYSDVDLERPDRERFPDSAGLEPKVVDVGPGEILFIPVGWWHQVRSLSVSVSLSFTNFVFPNDFDWY